ncbi:MAG: hypothetical protein ABIR15_14640 [Chitinophagaceae bacterium]
MIKEVNLPFDVTLTPVTILRAGELECMYELGKLRYIRRGNTELLRMIYAPVRNGYWSTLPYTITNEQIIAGSNNFSIEYTAIYQQETPVYKAYFKIEGKPDSSIVFSMKGEVLADFQKNRIGLCVHHPIRECSGQAVIITRPDGSEFQSVFPEMVSPHQPFLNIQEMQWTTDDDTTVKILFEGDIFETEDQRNWSDSSYKTYSTPLHIPFPVNVKAGDTMEQQIKLTAFNNPGNTELLEDNIREEKIVFPKIGYSRAVNQNKFTEVEIAWLKKIPFHHYRVVIVMANKGWEHELDNALEETLVLNTVLEMVVTFSDKFNEEVNALLALLQEKQSLLYSILVLQQNKRVTPGDLLMIVYPLVKKVLPGIQIGYGTDSNFVELNRNRPANTLFDFVSYSLHPQAHMVDNRSILENLDNQPDMITTAKSFAFGKPVFVSPVTIQDRYRILPDERKFTAMEAWWILVSIQQLSAAASISFCELFGDAGLGKIVKNKNGAMDSIQPSPFYDALAAIHLFEPIWIIKRYKGKNILLDGLMLENAKGERLFFKAPEEIINFRRNASKI